MNAPVYKRQAQDAASRERLGYGLIANRIQISGAIILVISVVVIPGASFRGYQLCNKVLDKYWQ